MKRPSSTAGAGRIAVIPPSWQPPSATMGTMTSTTDFDQAARSFLDLVAEVRPEQWGDPALGSWDVRSLVGHTARAISTVETYLLAEPAPAVSVPNAEAYYTEVLQTYTDNDSMAARGV